MGWMGKHNSTILVSFFTPMAFKNGLSTLAWTCNTHKKFELAWLYQSCHFHFDHSNITVIFKTHWVARTGRVGKIPPGSSELVGMGKPHLGRQSSMEVPSPTVWKDFLRWCPQTGRHWHLAFNVGKCEWFGVCNLNISTLFHDATQLKTQLSGFRYDVAGCQRLAWFFHVWVKNQRRK